MKNQINKKIISIIYLALFGVGLPGLFITNMSNVLALPLTAPITTPITAPITAPIIPTTSPLPTITTTPTPTSTPAPTEVPSPTATPTPIPIVNHNPKIIYVRIPVGQVNKFYFGKIIAYDQDKDKLTAKITNLPSGFKTYVYSRRYGKAYIYFYGRTQEAGEHNIQVKVSDSKGGQATKNYTLKIKAKPNNPPKIITSKLLRGIVGKRYRAYIFAYDKDRDQLKISIENLPFGLSFKSVSRRGFAYAIISGTTRRPGFYRISVQATDEHGAKTSKSYWLIFISKSRFFIK